MLALTPWQWTLVAALAALYAATCIRVALVMRRAGHNPWAWFVITLLLTAIPATVYLSCLRFKSLRPGAGGRDTSGGETAAPPGADDDSAGPSEDNA
ncbi:MAG: hypothetical protein ACOC8F_06305 [Planctomycetota bacterium]